MGQPGSIRVGVVGVGGRGGHVLPSIEAHDGAHVAAICDVDESALREAASTVDAEAYTDYDRLLIEAPVDAVVVGTPMPLHAEQSIAALERDVSVLCEVPAAISIAECRALVEAGRDSAGRYMLAENYVYLRENRLVGALLAAGYFGEPYYAEGEYLHELKGLNEETPWRRTWQTGHNGNTYPTHSLGPILDWWDDDRVERVSCGGSGHHYRDPRGDTYELEDTTVLLAETERDRLIKLRLDMLSDRPHAMTNYQLQGTAGCYEARRAPDEADRVWLSADHADSAAPREWRPLEAAAAEHLDGLPPDLDPDVDAGHGGSDYFVLRDFLDALAEETSPPIDLYRGLDMTLPGLASQASIADDGAWVDVPDPREW